MNTATPKAISVEQSPWYRWPGEWRRDQGFWREVVTRTMAAILAGVALSIPVAIYAVLATEWREAAASWIAGAIGLIIGLLISNNLMRRLDTKPARNIYTGALFFAVAIAIPLLIPGGLAFIAVSTIRLLV